MLPGEGVNTHDRWHGDRYDQSAPADAHKAAATTGYTTFTDHYGFWRSSSVLRIDFER
jgi:hypothetical protein